MPTYFTNYPVKSTDNRVSNTESNSFQDASYTATIFHTQALYLVNPGLDWCMQWAEQEGVAIQVVEE